jgi:hypothetical protein
MLQVIVEMLSELFGCQRLKHPVSIRYDRLRIAFDRLDAGDFGRYDSAVTIDNLLWWGVDGRTIDPSSFVTVRFRSHRAAQLFAQAFG